MMEKITLKNMWNEGLNGRIARRKLLLLPRHKSNDFNGQKLTDHQCMGQMSPNSSAWALRGMDYILCMIINAS